MKTNFFGPFPNTVLSKNRINQEQSVLLKKLQFLEM